MKFNPEFIERVSEANNLVDIISQYTQLKPAGGGLMGRCPFPDHPEKTPSFSVSEIKQVYNCFGCHKKGNIYTFLQQYNGMSFREAVEYLADRASIALPQVNERESQALDAAAQVKKQIGKVNKMAAHFFHTNFKELPESHPVRQYAFKRNLTPEIIDTFQIGYSLEDWDGLVKLFESKNIPMSLAEEARLVKARANGKSGYFDLFRERLMFPIFSTMGEPIAFGGRIVLQGEPKYLNSPETAVFHKSKVLYGLSETAKYIRSEDQAIVVEGYMDLVSLYQSGIQNVVATMGTAMTPDHGRLLHRITKNIVVLFDGDSAGQEAAERSLPLLLASDVYPRSLVLPESQDPDDYLRTYGVEQLKLEISKAPDLFSLILQRWLVGYRGEASEKVSLSTLLRPVFAAIRDQRLRQLYLIEAAGKMAVDPKWLAEAVLPSKNDFGQKQKTESFPRARSTAEGASGAENSQTVQKPVQQTVQASAAENLDQIQLKGATRAESLLLGLALKNHANFETLTSSHILEDVPHPGVREVLKRAADVSLQAPEKFDKLTSLLASYVDHPEWLIVDPQSMAKDGDDSKLILDCVRKIKLSLIQAKQKEILQQLRIVTDVTKLDEIKQALMDLKKEELNLNKLGLVAKL